MRNEQVGFAQKSLELFRRWKILFSSSENMTRRTRSCWDKKKAEDVTKAEEMTRQSLETFQENQKRKEIEKPLKKKQASGSNTMSYLKDTSKVESKRWAKELELRWKESGSKLKVPDFKINYLAVYSLI